jgi:hypothetical protein
MTRIELIKALRLFHYDPAWRSIKKGRKARHVVPMRALARAAGVNYMTVWRAVLEGLISERSANKLEPIVEKIMSGRGRFVFVARKGYEFQDDTRERMMGCPSIASSASAGPASPNSNSIGTPPRDHPSVRLAEESHASGYPNPAILGKLRRRKTKGSGRSLTSTIIGRPKILP